MTTLPLIASFAAAVGLAFPKGFNLVGYLPPAFAMVTAGIIVGLLTRGGIRNRKNLAPVQEISPEDQARLETELRRLAEAEDSDW